MPFGLAAGVELLDVFGPVDESLKARPEHEAQLKLVLLHHVLQGRDALVDLNHHSVVVMINPKNVLEPLRLQHGAYGQGCGVLGASLPLMFLQSQVGGDCDRQQDADDDDHDQQFDNREPTLALHLSRHFSPI
jgi:hypothetical protein